jgi:undecaprenyl-diphosphatase
MELIKSLLIGIVQGLTEFLPVSSSGHIEIFKELFDYSPENGLVFTLILHLATALSTVVVFHKEIVKLFKGLLAFKNNEETRYVLFIVISMIPAVFVGLFLEEQIEQLFDRNMLLVGGMLLITGLVLLWSDRVTNHEGELNFKNALIIGVVQAMAILPGISRSGSTIASAVILKIKRVTAAGFSFLMVLPLIAGASAKKVMDAGESSELLEQAFGADMLLGFVGAFLAGILACRWMIKLVQKSKLSYFAYYCMIVGTIALIYGLV